MEKTRVVFIENECGMVIIDDMDLDYSEYSDLIHSPALTSVSVNTPDGERLAVYVSDIGMFNPDADGRYLADYRTPLFGNMIIVGVDGDRVVDLPPSVTALTIAPLIGEEVYMSPYIEMGENGRRVKQ